MIRMIALILALIPHVSFASLFGTIEYRVAGMGGYGWEYLGTTTSSSANFSGTNYGGEVALKLNPQNYMIRGYTSTFALALVTGYNRTSGENSANTALQSETLTTSAFKLGLRAYLHRVFVGVGGMYSTAKVNSKVGGAVSSTAFSGAGFLAELGVELPLGSVFFISPRASYSLSSLTRSGESTSRNLSAFGVNTLLGIRF